MTFKVTASTKGPADALRRVLIASFSIVLLPFHSGFILHPGIAVCVSHFCLITTSEF